MGMGSNPCANISLEWSCYNAEDTDSTSKLNRRDPKSNSRKMATKGPRKGKNQVTLGRYPLMESWMV